RSFILMEELEDTISLEDLCKNWRQSPPAFTFKRKLLENVAHIAKTLHENGLNHRDFYLCHFLLKREHLRKEHLTLYLIDLHRTQIRSNTPARWIMKDLAGLYFSCKEIGLTKRDLYRFLQAYRNKNLRDIFNAEKTFWQKVENRGMTYCDHTKR